MKWIGRIVAVAAALACAGAPLAFAQDAAAGAAPQERPAARGYWVHMEKVGRDARHGAPFIGAGFRDDAFIGRTDGTLPAHPISGMTLAGIALGHDVND